MLLAVLLALSAAAPPRPHACDVTQPNHSVPPDRVLQRANIPADGPHQYPMMFGNDTIWTLLWQDGTVLFRKGGPGFVEPDGALKMKFFWMLATDGPLTLSGRRIDGQAPPLRSEIASGFVGAGYQPSYVIFPTQGCWEVTARANGSTLTFVTRVVKTF